MLGVLLNVVGQHVLFVCEVKGADVVSPLAFMQTLTSLDRNILNAGCRQGQTTLTCGGEEGSSQVVGVREPREDAWSWRATEQVQFPIHVQFVRVQLHLLCLGEGEQNLVLEAMTPNGRGI